MNCTGYCKSRNFCENFIFANSFKRHICDVKNSGLGHDLAISTNDRLIMSFPKDFIFSNSAYAIYSIMVLSWTEMLTSVASVSFYYEYFG